MASFQNELSSNRSSGMTFARVLTRPEQHPFDAITFERRSAKITGPDGHIIFEMNDVEIPASWSQLATDIVVSKYFRKAGVPETGSETSVRQVIHRITHTIRAQGEKTGIFATSQDAETFEMELTHMLVNQMGAFNSPVWFNCGLWHEYGISGSEGNWFWNPASGQIEPATNAYEHPQCSACFIQSVDDHLMDIFELMKTEARLFKYGSGTGTNFSRIRGKQEKLSGGGYSSGVMSFLEVLDRGAGVIKSGGTTRRAAKMVCLDMDHPEIVDFIHWKRKEELKVKALIEAGYSGDFNGEAYQTVSGQNANNSVRLSDRFMQAYLNDGPWETTLRTTGETCETFQARDLMRQISEAAWFCADPGVQFDDVINHWNTCLNSGRIRGSNPCSEFHFLDDTACNLASLNLLKFLGDDGQFDVKAFRHACRVFFTAQEILVDFASYPTREIAQNSHDFRPLGLGYANLGALLMVSGIPYDSEGALALTQVLTAILHGEAYRTSAEIAARLGAFPRFAENRDPMLRVMQQHHDALKALQSAGPMSDLMRAALQIWEEVLALGQKYGYRNAQATVLAPTGTIGLLMDCDTTGIEPDFSLIKWKKLAGGGYFKIVNQCVPKALKNLGYREVETADILAFVEKNGTVEGAPHLKPEDYAVFDCASPSGEGQRYIQPMAHVRIMAAAQPFLSGAISKTVNLPHSATVEEIEAIYVTAWELGLKGVALYRDGSKFSQPLTTQSQDALGISHEPLLRGMRLQPPGAAEHFEISVQVAGQTLRLQMEAYADQALAGFSVDGAFSDEAFKALLQCWAYAVSLGLQYGVPLEAFVNVFAWAQFGPKGMTDHPNIRQCNSLVDLIVRILAVEYLGQTELAQVPPNEVQIAAIQARLAAQGRVANSTLNQSESISAETARAHQLQHLMGDAPPCSECGSITVRDGACYRCDNCGHTEGCA